jgi:hypothetical protein
MRITDRLHRLEEADRARPDGVAAQEAAAARVSDTILGYANRFSEDEYATPLDQRIATMSPAQHFAWGLRFQAEPTPLAAVMQMHGLAVPMLSKEMAHAHR